jgi:hypothetical protein
MQAQPTPTTDPECSDGHYHTRDHNGDPAQELTRLDASVVVIGETFKVALDKVTEIRHSVIKPSRSYSGYEITVARPLQWAW